MPRPRNALPAKRVHLHLPGDVWPKLEIYLFSEMEQRVPFGAYQDFVTKRIREYFEWASLDLSEFFPHVPPGNILKGPKELVDLVRTELKERMNVLT